MFNMRTMYSMQVFVQVSGFAVLLTLASGCIPLAQADAAHLKAGGQDAYQVLKDNSTKVVQSLPKGEREILMAMLSLQAGRLDEAIETLQKPSLAHDPLVSLIKAEVYRRQAVKEASQAKDYVASLQENIKHLRSASLNGGLVEAKRRLRAFTEKLQGHYGIPFDLLEISSRVANVFVVDKARSRMFVFGRDGQGRMHRIADEYVVTGASPGDKKQVGDARTPSGIYRFVDRLSGRRLPNGYGPVAFPIDYPNALDQAHHHNGYGIWMHGYADGIGRRPPQDTKGCFVLTNQRLLAMAKQVRLGRSWVIIGENIVFGNEARKKELLRSVQSAVSAWQRDWESLDVNAYLSHYHPRFRSGRHNLKSWSLYKRRIGQRKKYIHLSLSDFTIIHNPARVREGETVLVEFNQRYQSNNFSGVSRKRLYLVRKDAHDTWKILIEREIEEKALPRQQAPNVLFKAGTNGKTAPSPESTILHPET